MRLFSTGGRAPLASFREALLNGLAPDGGLYLPEAVPPISAAEWASWRGLPFDALSSEVASRWLDGEFPRSVVDRLVRDALDFPVPLVPLPDGLQVLELFHGPTLAFKDFGARFLARFFGHVLAERGRTATILVATSGDTGSAVARGFAGVPGVRVVVLYPRGRISPFQEAQIASIGGNVTALRVPGAFDDCQRLVKDAFRDARLRALHLSSANSINIGRLLPQSFYYAFAALAAGGGPDRPVAFAVPSGNLGNLTAGVLAALTGVPVHGFVAATNANDVLPAYLASGVFAPRPSTPTISNAMDVGDPSNFVRLERLCGGTVDGMRTRVEGIAVTDDDTRAEVRRAHRSCGYVFDPHGAVACAAARRWRAARPGDVPMVVLATAHPAKFADTIAPEVGFVPALPAHEQDWPSRRLLAIDLADTTTDTFREFLLGLERR